MIDKLAKILTASIIILALNTVVLAGGFDLNDIKIIDLKDRIKVILTLENLPKGYFVDKNQPSSIKLTLLDTFLGSKLIKNLDVVLNDNIRWKQYTDKLEVSIEHKGISRLSRVYNADNSKDIIVEIPKTEDFKHEIKTNIVKGPSQSMNNSSLVRVGNVSRSMSTFRDKLPSYVVENKSNDNNKIFYKQIIPGVNYIKILRKTCNGPLIINVIDIAPNNPNIKVIPALANERIFGKKTIRTIVRQNNGIAGINAGFFKPPTGVPLGTVIIDDELISGPIFDRVTLGITKDNKYRIERIRLTGELIKENGKTIILDNVNQPRISKDHYLLYSYRWGYRSPEGAAGSKQISLVNGIVKEISTSSLEIQKNGYVIVGPDQGLFSDVRIGDKLKLIVTTDPDWSDIAHAIGGGPFLLKNSQVYVDHEAQQFSIKNTPEPRTAVGVTKEDHLLLVTVDGRQKNVSIGVTFYQLAEIMQELGAINAMNLDGGSSTQMCINDQVVNSPTVSGGNNVSNGLIVIPR